MDDLTMVVAAHEPPQPPKEEQETAPQEPPSLAPPTPPTPPTPLDALTVPELKQRCKALGLATNLLAKAQLVECLEHPDEHRAMCNGVWITVTETMDIEKVRAVAAAYGELGHPCKQNIAAWKERSGVTGTDTGAWDSRIYGLCAKLKPTSTSKRPLASGGSSGGGGGPPSESTEPAAKAKKTPFTADENALYLTLLRRHGRPLKKNAEAWAAFRNAFPNRLSDSWAGHMQHFTTDEAGEWVVKKGVD